MSLGTNFTNFDCNCLKNGKFSQEYISDITIYDMKEDHVRSFNLH